MIDKDDIPELIVWTHRWHEKYEPKILESIGRTVRSIPYRISVMIDPGNCHENMQKALDMSVSRYICLLDEDIIFLQEGWLERMLSVIKSDESLGILGCEETYDKVFADAIMRGEMDAQRENRVVVDTWIPAYMMLIDRERLPDLSIPQDIPGIKGMTDVDLCYQAKAAGKVVAVDHAVLVYHEEKGKWDAETMLAHDQPTHEEQRAVYPTQVEWLVGRWGKQDYRRVGQK
jgi:hypothetical protein